MVMRKINLNDMYIFTKVAENKSITLASRMLNTSKQTVSRKIVQLEEALGVSLILRTTRNFELTSAGQEYYETCSQIIEQAELANVRVQEFQDSPVGTIRLGMPKAFNTSIMTRLLTDFLDDNPDLEMEITLADHRVCLVNDNVDVIFRVGNLEDSSMIARNLGKIRFCHVVNPKYIEKNGIPSGLHDLVNHTLIGIQSGECTQNLYDAKKSKERILVDEFSLARQFALEGVGICVMPLFMCIDDILRGDLILIDNACFFCSADVHLLFLKSKYIPGYVRRFIDYIVSTCSPCSPWELMETNLPSSKVALDKEVDLV